MTIDTAELEYCEDCFSLHGYMTVNGHRMKAGTCSNPFPYNHPDLLPYYSDRRRHLQQQALWAEQDQAWKVDHAEVWDGDK